MPLEMRLQSASIKEDAHDYRYFPEPDLSPIIIKQEYIDKIKSELPALPEELYTKYTKEFGLSDYDAKNSQTLKVLRCTIMKFQNTLMSIKWQPIL